MHIINIFIASLGFGSLLVSGVFSSSHWSSTKDKVVSSEHFIEMGEPHTTRLRRTFLFRQLEILLVGIIGILLFCCVFFNVVSLFTQFMFAITILLLGIIHVYFVVNMIKRNKVLDDAELIINILRIRNESKYIANITVANLEMTRRMFEYAKSKGVRLKTLEFIFRFFS